LLVTECELLPEQRFDIYLVHLGIAIEVDGEQHFEGSYYGTPAALQFARDRKKDAMCLEAGQKLVRLHYGHRGVRQCWQRFAASASSHTALPTPVVRHPAERLTVYCW